MRNETKKKPAHSISLSNVEVSIWPNETGGDIWHSVTVKRRYRQAEELKSSASLAQSDIPNAIFALGEALRWMRQERLRAKEQLDEAVGL